MHPLLTVTRYGIPRSKSAHHTKSVQVKTVMTVASEVQHRITHISVMPAGKGVN